MLGLLLLLHCSATWRQIQGLQCDKPGPYRATPPALGLVIWRDCLCGEALLWHGMYSR